MSTDEIAGVMELMDRHGIAAFDYDDGTASLRLRRGAGATSVVARELAEADADGSIRSPGVGTFLLRHPGASVPAVLPRAVRAGEVVAMLRTGPLLNGVVSERDCILTEVLVAEGTGVGYGTRLFVTQG